MRLVFLSLLSSFAALGQQPDDRRCRSNMRFEPWTEATRIADSLRAAGVDTVLTYCHFWGHNGVNGYAKIVWRDTKELRLAETAYTNRTSDGGLLPTRYGVLSKSDPLSFWAARKLDTVTTYPHVAQPEVIIVGFYEGHIVRMRAGRDSVCFEIPEGGRTGEPAHPKAQLVNLLTEDKPTYFTKTFGLLDTLPAPRFYFHSGSCFGACPQIWFSLGPGRELRGGVIRYQGKGMAQPYPASGSFGRWLSRADYTAFQKKAGTVPWEKLKVESVTCCDRPIVDLRIIYKGKQYSFRSMKLPKKKLRDFTDWIEALCERLPLPCSDKPDQNPE